MNIPTLDPCTTTKAGGPDLADDKQGRTLVSCHTRAFGAIGRDVQAEAFAFRRPDRYHGPWFYIGCCPRIESNKTGRTRIHEDRSCPCFDPYEPVD